jgi:hypothetical protein
VADNGDLGDRDKLASSINNRPTNHQQATNEYSTVATIR